MLPGSTGMPKCSIWPPACSTAAGITSRRSTMTEAPCTSTISAPDVDGGGDEQAQARRRYASQRSSDTSAEPSAVSRASVTCAGLVENAFLQPRQPRLDQRDPARREGGDPQQRSAFGREARRRASTASSGTANGMILTVATICRGSTTAKGGKVPSVTASSTRLSRSSRSRSNTRRPRASANRLARPVKAGAAVTFAPADGGGDPVGRLVLAQIARIEPRRDDIGRPRPRRSPRHRPRDSTRPFLERGRAEAKAVRQDRARRLADRDFAESHTLKPTEAFAPDRYVGASAAPG